MHFVGRKGQNWFFRGPDPIINNNFAYAQLRKIILNKSLSNKDSELGDKFKITSLTLSQALSHPYLIEKKFFDKHKDKGKLVYINYPEFSAKIRDINNEFTLINNELQEKGEDHVIFAQILAKHHMLPYQYQI